MPLIVAENATSSFIRSSVFANSVRSCRQSAEGLVATISEITRDARDYDTLVNEFNIYQVKTAYGQFKIALQAELGVSPAFFVTQKGSHDTLSLLDAPETMFPSELRGKVPEAMFDVHEAGKALAYDLPTACGFHVFRATESVLRRYYSSVTGNSPRPKVRSIVIYVTTMRQKKVGDERILSTLEQMAKLHRNPLIHPEAAPSLDEALTIVGMARSVISAMLTTLASAPPTTNTAMQ
ncbi:hypothetical protein MKK69_18980 [Methylobacterium sp. J-026]|nr:hypothetical protein [Methylobacterium sp. J-026]